MNKLKQAVNAAMADMMDSKGNALPKGAPTDVHANDAESRKPIGNPKVVQLNYEGMGKQDGKKVHDAEHAAHGTEREVLMLRAEQFGGNEQVIKDWLTGYGFIMGATRKSEARAVFEAWQVTAYSRPVLDKEGKPVKDADGKIVEKTLSGADWLAGEKCDRHTWFTLARLIRGKKNNGAGTNNSKVRGINDGDAKKLTGRIKASPMATVETIVQASAAALASLPEGQAETSILRAILAQVNALKKKSKEPFFLNIAAEIQDLCDAGLNGYAESLRSGKALSEKPRRKQDTPARKGVKPASAKKAAQNLEKPKAEQQQEQQQQQVAA